MARTKGAKGKKPPRKQVAAMLDQQLVKLIKAESARTGASWSRALEMAAFRGLRTRTGRHGGVRPGYGRETEQEWPTLPPPEPPPPDTSPTLLTFPTVGRLPTWPLREAQVASWQAAYPTLDILRVCRDTLAYLEANPMERKVGAAMPRYLEQRLIDAAKAQQGQQLP